MKTAVAFIALYCAVFVVRDECLAHTLGLHGLSGENPIQPPDLPEITEAFEATVHVRFRKETEEYQSIFHWTTNDMEDYIYLGHKEKKGSETKFVIKRGGTTTTCAISTSLKKEQDYVLKFSVDASGLAKIFIDGTLVHSSNNMVIPINVPRNHHLGFSLLDGDEDHIRMDGSVTGLRITNDGDKPHHPSSAFKFLNFPGQSFDKGFVVSFYARYDDLISETHEFQPVFDFGNGKENNNIWCGQREKTTKMSCEVYYGDTDNHTVIEAPVGSLEEGQWAFWHAGLDADGRFWIQKNGNELVAKNITMPHNTFRRSLRFSYDHWDDEDMLDGVVLGLRLDRLPPS